MLKVAILSTLFNNSDSISCFACGLDGGETPDWPYVAIRVDLHTSAGDVRNTGDPDLTLPICPTCNRKLAHDDAKLVKQYAGQHLIDIVRGKIENTTKTKKKAKK